jgi:hypothetical protein
MARRMIMRRYDSRGVLEEQEREDWRALIASQGARAFVGAMAGVALAPTPEQRFVYACGGAMVSGLLPDVLSALGESRLPEITIHVIDKASYLLALRFYGKSEAQAWVQPSSTDELPSEWHYVALDAKRMLRHTFDWIAAGESGVPWSWRNCQQVIERRPGIRTQDAWKRAMELWRDAGIITDKRGQPSITDLLIKSAQEGYAGIHSALVARNCILINGVWYDK